MDGMLQSVREITLLQAVINSIPAPVFFKDDKGVYLGCNAAFEQFVGLSRSDLIGKDVFELWDEDLAKVYDITDQALLKSGGKQMYEGNVTYADGSIHDVVFHKAVFYAEKENISGIVGVMLDITERKRVENELAKLACTDALTGLGNRHSFYENLTMARKRTQRHKSDMALLALDLDGFKAVNDTYGHQVGDDLLIEVANRLRSIFRDVDQITRLGGDEFFIVLEDVGNADNVSSLSLKMVKEISTPYQIKSHEIEIGVSAGVTLYDGAETSNEALIREADIALYSVKENGKKGYAFFGQPPNFLNT